MLQRFQLFSVTLPDKMAFLSSNYEAAKTNKTHVIPKNALN